MSKLQVWLLVGILYSPVLYQLIRGIIIHREELLLKGRVLLKYLVIAITPPLILLGIVWHVNIFDYEKPKSYSEINSISFKNFRGMEFFRNEFMGSSRYAYIVTSLETEIYDDSVTIEAYFHPSRSYVYNQYVTSEELLRHELYHFKITEVHSRLAKKRIAALDTFSREKAGEIIDHTKEDEWAFQKKYDFDTFHSYVYSEQKRYENQIDSMLLALNEYKKAKIIVNE